MKQPYKSKHISVALVLYALMCCAAWKAAAAPVGVDRAERVARHFWNAHRPDGTKMLEGKLVAVVSPFSTLHIFTCADSMGFVVVAADDCVEPVLAYSFESPVCSEVNREALYMLGCYHRQIEECRRQRLEASSEVRARWQRYDGEPTKGDPLTIVAPMLTTTWDQSPRYNNHCPTHGGSSVHAVTGCVATAMGQVMRYWSFPLTGIGEHTYQTNTYGAISASFETTTYDWENMPQSLSQGSSAAQVNAVATLLFHCGVSVDMQYGPQHSSAMMTDGGLAPMPCAQHGLVTYFGYSDSLQACYRAYYTDEQWHAVVKEEIDARRPVLYAGNDRVGGHCFVCDGYDASETRFHFNWGWSGSYNGYYLLTDLTLGSAGLGGGAAHVFNSDQEILIGVRPAAPDSGDDPDPVEPCLIEEFPYAMNFDNDSALQCVVFDNANHDTVRWRVVSRQGVRNTRCAKISYATPNDDYIRLPLITMPGPYELEWKVRSHNALYTESFEVLLGPNVIRSETGSWSSFQAMYDTIHLGPDDTLGVSFRCVSDDRYGLYFDDIVIRRIFPLSGPCVAREVTDTVETCGQYVWRGKQFGESGLYFDTVPRSVTGRCDSIYSLQLTIDYASRDTLLATACEPYLWRGNRYEQTGVYADTVRGAADCDSLFVLSLRVGQPFFDTLVACVDESFEWRDRLLTQSGVYSDHFYTVEGCDSVYTLQLTVGIIGVDETEAVSVRLYPNPTAGVVVLEGVRPGITAELYDLAGRRQAVYTINDTTATLDLGALPPGHYLLRLAGTAVRVTRK